MQNGLRERLLNFGPTSMSDAELLSILLSTSGPGHADEVAMAVLEAVGCPQGLLSRRPAELAAIAGMSAAKADRLLAAIELGRRACQPVEPGSQVLTAADVAGHCVRYAGEPNEVFIALSVNSRNRVVGEWVVARGWESGVNLTPRQIFTLLVKEGCSRCLFVHNHPSGDPAPSPEDVRFTARLIEAARTLDIKILDHVIVASGGHASLREVASRSLDFG